MSGFGGLFNLASVASLMSSLGGLFEVQPSWSLCCLASVASLLSGLGDPFDVWPRWPL